MTQCDHTGSGEGGAVHHGRRFERLAEREGIGQDQAAFRVGIDDLYRLTLSGPNHVPGFYRATAEKVL